MAKKPSHNKTTQSAQGFNVSEPRKQVDRDPRERVNLDPEAFDRLIRQHGPRVHIYRTLYCPNVKSIDGGEHEIDCDMCNGSGFLDVRPITTHAFLQNQTLEMMQAAEGMTDGNTVFISFPIGVELQYFTLVELCDHTEVFFEKVARSKGKLDRLKYKALRVNVLIDKNRIEYFQGQDFKLNDNGDIIWLDGKGPLPEVIYSVHYEAKIQFRAIRAIHSNRFEQVKDDNGTINHVKFQEQWLCAKEFLVRRKDDTGQDLLPNLVPGYEEGTPGSNDRNS